jgi:phage tail tape-measure protein
MKSSEIARRASAITLVSVCASCATWNEMDRSEKGTAVGATGGAVVGAAVGGPVGALVGGGVGGYAGHHEGAGQPSRNESVSTRRVDTVSPSAGGVETTADSAIVRSVQQSLNQRGYDAGTVDGRWGTNTENALRQFQQANGLAPTGSLDQQTLSALGVSR